MKTQKTNKIPIFDWFYEQGDVYVTVITKHSDDVVVPPQFKQKETETFVVGEVPTPHLSYDEYGISSPMRFGDITFNCYFPWESVIRLMGQSAVIQFANEEKSESEIKQQKKKPSFLNKNKKEKKKGNILKLVK